MLDLDRTQIVQHDFYDYLKLIKRLLTNTRLITQTTAVLCCNWIRLVTGVDSSIILINSLIRILYVHGMSEGAAFQWQST